MTAGELAAAIRATAALLPAEPDVPLSNEQQAAAHAAACRHLRAVEPVPLDGPARDRVVRNLLNAQRRLSGLASNPVGRFVQARRYLATAAAALEG